MSLFVLGFILNGALHVTDGVDFWETRWKRGTTPWDLGAPTPILVELLQAGRLPKGRALIPGCGSVSFSIISYSLKFLFIGSEVHVCS